MERTLSPDERIKRAEEIYYRKKIQANNRNSARVNVSEQKDFRNVKKDGFTDTYLCCYIHNFLYDTKHKLCIF